MRTECCFRTYTRSSGRGRLGARCSPGIASSLVVLCHRRLWRWLFQHSRIFPVRVEKTRCVERNVRHGQSVPVSQQPSKLASCRSKLTRRAGREGHALSSRLGENVRCDGVVDAVMLHPARRVGVIHPILRDRYPRCAFIQVNACSGRQPEHSENTIESQCLLRWSSIDVVEGRSVVLAPDPARTRRGWSARPSQASA